MSEPLRLGLLSTAAINDALIAGARAAGAEIAAVASRDAERARAYAAEREIPRAHGSYEELLADPDVEAVYISLPNSLHVPWSLRALEAGKHVLCEKPLARRAADAERAVALATERGLHLSEGFMWRHTPQTLRISELLDEGRIGRLRFVRAQFSFPEREPGDVRLSRELEGGALMDVGCYCVSAIRLAGGEPEAVSGVQIAGGEGVDIRFAAVLKLPGGALAHFDCGMDSAHRHELELVGEQASLFVADPWHSRAPGIEWRHDGETERIDVAAADPYACQVENFAAAVRDGSPLRLGGEDAVAQAKVIEALYASADTGREIPL
jgi:predicted dehydrogenase